MDKRAQTCCFTGHRHLPAGEEEAIWQRVQEHLIPLLEQGVRYFGIGGALGFDTLVAEKLLELRGKYPQIRVILVLPFRGYQSCWTAAQQAQTARIELQVDKVVYCCDTPSCEAFWPATGICGRLGLLHRLLHKNYRRYGIQTAVCGSERSENLECSFKTARSFYTT